MRSKITLILVLLASIICAQDVFNYQAAIRDGSGDLLINTFVGVQFSILQSTSTGNVSYAETHSVNTNAYGMVNIEVGGGTPVAGQFSAINWAAYDHFLKVEVNTGSGYVHMGTSQLNYVPYAHYANLAEVAVNDNDNQTLSLVNATLSISGGNSVNIPASSALWNANKLNGNDVSTLSPSIYDVLKWTGTSWAPGTDEGTTYLMGYGLTLYGNYINSSWTYNGNHVFSNNTGNIGIGLNNPVDKLHLHGDNTASFLRITYPASGVTSIDGLRLGYNNAGVAYLLNYENTNMNFSTNNLVRMTIENTGNVGIGTSSPTSNLHIYGATGEDPFRVQVAGATKLMVHANGGLGIGFSTFSPPTDGLLVEGNVAVGVTTPQSRVHVSSATSTSESSIRLTRSTTGITSSDGFWFGYSSNGYNYMWGYENNNLSIGTNDSFRMTVQNDGDVGIGTASPSYDLQMGYNSAAKPTSSAWTVISDTRLKDEVSSFDDGLDLVMQIRPILFKYNGKIGLPMDEIGVGTMAQELQQIAPYMVKSFVYTEGTTAGPEETINNTGRTEEYLAVDYGAMDFVLVNAVKELKQQLDEQQALIQELRSKVESLQNR